MERSKKKGRRASPPAAIEISLTPLIDTVLVLLVTFMVAMPVMQNAIKIELPRGSSHDDQIEAAHSSDGITVYIDKQRHLFLNEQPVKEYDLIDRIEQKLGKARNQVVFVKADRAVPYGDVVHVVDSIKFLGRVEYVALATQNE